MNHPAWSLGHLAVAGHDVCRMLGTDSDMPAAWKDTFKTGGVPPGARAAFPAKDHLLRILEQQHERAAEALAAIDPAALSGPNPNERARAVFPTFGDLVVYLMTAHEMDHLGQVAAWRRAMGLGPAQSG